MAKTSAKESTNRVLTTSDTKTITTRSQINVIQSTTTSKSVTNGFICVTTGDRQINSNTSASADDSVHTSSNSNNNIIVSNNSNDSVEYVDFGAITLLANTSTQ